MPEPKIAVLGCGYWGQNLVRNFSQLNALALICDPAESARTRARTVAEGVETIDSFEDAFRRADIDAVVLATPAITHHPLALRALDSGKDVFVEKPMALDYRHGLEMDAKARTQGRILMVGHVLEYHPAVQKICELVEAGELGKINYIYSNRLNFGKIRSEENAYWSFAPHDIAIINRIFGKAPIEVTCVGGSYITQGVTDIAVSCLLYSTGQRAHIFVSWLNPFKEQKLVVVGDKKMAVFNDTMPQDKLLLYDQHVDLSGREPVLQKGRTISLRISADEPLRIECQRFLEAIKSREQPLTDAASGIQVLKVLQACQVSLQSNGRPTLLSEV